LVPANESAQQVDGLLVKDDYVRQLLVQVDEGLCGQPQELQRTFLRLRVVAVILSALEFLGNGRVWKRALLFWGPFHFLPLI
jgi:hypothetical protein